MSKLGGIILSIIGGILSIVVFGILLLVLYPELLILGRLFVTIFQVVVIMGGILTLLGAFISIFSKSEVNKKLGYIVILIGAIAGGGNIISIIGAINLKKESQNVSVKRIKCPVCNYENVINTRICRYCGEELVSTTNS